MADQDDFVDEPIEELKEHLVEVDRDLPGRVRRSINRNVLAADSLELMFTGLTSTAWNYIELALNYFDVLKSSGARGGPGGNGRPPKDEEPGS